MSASEGGGDRRSMHPAGPARRGIHPKLHPAGSARRGIHPSRRAVLALGAAGLATSLAAALAGCAPAPAARRIRMACGEPGGTYIRFGQLLARAAVDAGIAADMRALPTEGSVENVELLRSGEAELAIALADTAAARADGIVAIGRVYQNYLQCIVREDSGIAAPAGLAGRRVSIGAPGSGTATMSLRAFAALGLAPAGGAGETGGADGARIAAGAGQGAAASAPGVTGGVQGAAASAPGTAVLLELGLADAVGALATGDIDAVMWSGGIPLPELSRLDGITRVRLLDLTAAVPAMNRDFGDAYAITAVPAGTYGLTEAVPAIGVSNFLLARPELPGELARAFVDLLLEEAPRLVPQPSIGLQYLTSSSLIDTAPIPSTPPPAAASASATASHAAAPRSLPTPHPSVPAPSSPSPKHPPLRNAGPRACRGAFSRMASATRRARSCIAQKRQPVLCSAGRCRGGCGSTPPP
ncbi:TAXI family TRAP transporter solute-binding subunit [Agromyces archimandritae]|uniref:TAXI family TRAP transporter solute-binding subunit n=1 Tax=Agromyces archimandritae TaxID=2781962 RepID=A0A975FNS7_9MICO|nr:TAXI family TRAP transporter solute-binding subunit [Agromyces archimandritae]QTX05853.1 TAXI family TRAP transporter solute-binding subunit [Agromyces archimandritae]